MSSLSGLLGGAGGAGGTGFSSAQGTNQNQLDTAYNQTQAGINQQQDFVNALNRQNGLGNQASVFQQQQGLANQLQGVANGAGPNPAMAQLAQSTGANTANQAALMAGQRGAGANAGLIARQAAMQGANTQQQAVGQGATMQAQQSLAALQQLQNQQSSMGNMANTMVGQQQAGLSALNQNSAQQQSNLLGMQANQNNNNTQLANTTAQGQQNVMGGLMNGVGGVLSTVASNPELALLAAEGGEVPRKKYADGGPAFDPIMKPVQSQQVTDQSQNAASPQSGMGKMLAGAGSAMADHADDSKKSQLQTGTSNLMSGALDAMFAPKAAAPVEQTTDPFNSTSAPSVSNLPQAGTPGQHIDMSGYAKGGQVPALVSPGEIRIHAKDVPKIAQGQKSPLDGEKIPGKPKVGGAKNSYANDTVPKTLNEGDIILPRSVTQSKDPATAAHKFVSAIMAKNGKSMPKRAK